MSSTVTTARVRTTRDRKDIIAAAMNVKEGDQLHGNLHLSTYRKALLLPGSQRYAVEHYAASVRRMDDATLAEASLDALRSVKAGIGSLTQKTFDRFRIDVTRDECARRDAEVHGVGADVESRYATLEEAFDKEVRAAARAHRSSTTGRSGGIRWS